MSDLLMLSWEVLLGGSCESPVLQLLPCRSHWPPFGDVKRTPPLATLYRPLARSSTALRNETQKGMGAAGTERRLRV